jgi:hypothetical protein
MQKRVGLVAFLAITWSGIARAQSSDEQEAMKYGWTFSLARGKALAKERGVPLMVVLRCVP